MITATGLAARKAALNSAAASCVPSVSGGGHNTPDTATATHILDALRTVQDPEYPGISVIDMGMVGDVSIDAQAGRVEVELIPTFSGCPALNLIATDIKRAVGAISGVAEVSVLVSAAAWDPSMLSQRARAVLAQEFGLAAAVSDEPLVCPRCGHTGLAEQSPFGPARCRAVSRCNACNEVVEVLRA